MKANTTKRVILISSLLDRGSQTALALAVAGTIATASQVATADLLHHYPFDSDASDSVGNADGTLQNGVAIVNGVLVLDGVDDFVLLDEKIVPTSGDFSVAVWVKPTTLGHDPVEVISQGFSGGPGFYIGKGFATTLRIGDSWINTGITFPQAGEWTHIAMTSDAIENKAHIYIDGQLVAQRIGAVGVTSAGENTRFGKQFPPFAEHFHGEIDDIRVFDHVLSEAEAMELGGENLPGACCLPDDSCVFTTETDCLTQGGTFEGAVTSCFATECDSTADCPGDVDGNNSVDVNDLLALLTAFGTSDGDPNYDPAADLFPASPDGVINVFDLLQLISLMSQDGCAP